jgi:hypothetical protein
MLPVSPTLRSVFALSLVAGCALASAQTSYLGTTRTQALKMGYGRWDEKLETAPNGTEQATYMKGLNFYLAAHRARNAALLKKRAAALRKVAKAYSDAFRAMEAAYRTSGGGDPAIGPSDITAFIQIEGLIYHCLTKGKMPKELVSGNQFAEITDAWADDVRRFAAQNKVEAKVAPLLEAAITKTQDARGAMNGLTEGEGHLFRFAMAHWFNPEFYSFPITKY